MPVLGKQVLPCRGPACCSPIWPQQKTTSRRIRWQNSRSGVGFACRIDPFFTDDMGFSRRGGVDCFGERHIAPPFFFVPADSRELLACGFTIIRVSRFVNRQNAF